MNNIITDIKVLQEETLLNLKNSKAINTVRAYKSDFNDFGLFCAQNGFKSLPTALFYIVAQVMLGLHLTHGIHSMSRSLGISNPVWTERAAKAAVATGIGITVGNIAIVLFGMIAG